MSIELDCGTLRRLRNFPCTKQKLDPPPLRGTLICGEKLRGIGDCDLKRFTSLDWNDKPWFAVRSWGGLAFWPLKQSFNLLPNRKPTKKVCLFSWQSTSKITGWPKNSVKSSIYYTRESPNSRYKIDGSPKLTDYRKIVKFDYTQNAIRDTTKKSVQEQITNFHWFRSGRAAGEKNLGAFSHTAPQGKIFTTYIYKLHWFRSVRAAGENF